MSWTSIKPTGLSAASTTGSSSIRNLWKIAVASAARASAFILLQSAVITSSVVGPHVSVAAGARVQHSIIRDSIVGEGALITNSLLDSSLVGDNAVVKGSYQKLTIGDLSEVEAL